MYKKIFVLILLLLILPIFAFAQESGDVILKAEVIEITEQRENVLPDGTKVEQQNLKLEILEGKDEGEIVDFEGIGNFDVVKKNFYKVGDQVILDASTNAIGETNYYITDYVRTPGLLYLFVLFCLVLFFVGGARGARSLISLVLSFLIIIKFIIPKIIAGSNPFLITILGSFIILLAVIYITEGFNKRSHVSVISIFISLILTFLISSFFVSLTKLSGLASEETMFLISFGEQTINFKGLLLAGIIIGALGVLDDVVISQVVAVEQIVEANPEQDRKQIFKRAYEVGISHINSMTNTLFLAYAGASLPLLILFLSGESAFSSWGQIINNEAIATEIVRTLAGSIGLITAVPISTFIATKVFQKK
jgi:uncharacterized membrane protein